MGKQAGWAYVANVDDVQSMLNNILVLSTLLLGFVISIYLQSISVEELIAADENYIRGERVGGKSNFFELITVDYFTQGNITISVFFAVVWFTMFMDLSFRFSGVRNDEEVFDRWWKVFKWGVLFCYALIITGIYYLYETINTWTTFTFPAYPEDSYDDKTMFSKFKISPFTGRMGAMDFKPDTVENQVFYNLSHTFSMTTYGIFSGTAIIVFFVHWLYVVYNKEVPGDETEVVYDSDEDAQKNEAGGPDQKWSGDVDIFVGLYQDGKISAMNLADLIS